MEPTGPAGRLDVRLREVREGDLDAFRQHQEDALAVAMAAFPARDPQQFAAHWRRILSDPSVTARTVTVDDHVAGNCVAWSDAGRREVGYWLGRSHWGRGVATRALALFLKDEVGRPLYAFVAEHNAGSRRVLEKCGFAATDPDESFVDDGVRFVGLRLPAPAASVEA